MNFLNIIHYPVYGGPHNRAVRLNKELENRGFKTIVLLPREGIVGANRFENSGINLIIKPLSRVRATFNINTQVSFIANFWRDIKTIRNIIRKENVGLVLISGLANPHGVIAAVLENKPVVWQITDTRTPLVLRLLMMEFVKKFANAVMFNGESLFSFHQKKPDLKVPCFIYYPPVDIVSFNKSATKRSFYRYNLGLSESIKVVGMVANLNPQKGIEYFIRAASIIYRSYRNCFFLVVGAKYENHKKYNEIIKKEIKKSCIPTDRIIFAGEKRDVENYYNVMDVKIISSVPNSEGTTTTAIEAMACGVPVVASDVGAIREVIDNGKNGFIVPALEPEAIAKSTLNLLNNPTLHKKLSIESRQKAVNEYDIKVCADKHMHAFEAAIEHKKLKDTNIIKRDYLGAYPVIRSPYRSVSSEKIN